MDDHEGVFTLSTRGDGVARNCTLTTLLFAGNFQILESTMSGVRSGDEGPEAPVIIIQQCNNSDQHLAVRLRDPSLLYSYGHTLLAALPGRMRD